MQLALGMADVVTAAPSPFIGVSGIAYQAARPLPRFRPTVLAVCEAQSLALPVCSRSRLVYTASYPRPICAPTAYLLARTARVCQFAQAVEPSFIDAFLPAQPTSWGQAPLGAYRLRLSRPANPSMCALRMHALRVAATWLYLQSRRWRDPCLLRANIGTADVPFAHGLHRVWAVRWTGWCGRWLAFAT